MICRSRGVLTFLTDIGHETNLKSKSEPCTPELPDSIPELQRQVIVFRISAAAHEAIRICKTALLTTSYPFSSSHFTIPSISFHHLNMPLRAAEKNSQIQLVSKPPLYARQTYRINHQLTVHIIVLQNSK